MKPKFKQTPSGKQIILNMNQESVVREFPKSFKELEKIIETIWHKQSFQIQYEMNGKLIDIHDEKDFLEVEQDDEDLQLKLTPKPKSPSSSRQSIDYQLDFYDAFFQGDDFKCCNNSNCKTCKGNGKFQLTSEQKFKINDEVKKAVEKKFTQLQKIYLNQYNIKLEEVKDFLIEHKNLIKQNKLASLTNVLSKLPTQSTQQPMSSLQPGPSVVTQYSHGFQYSSSLMSGIRQPKSSFISQSQIMSTQSVGAGLSAQFKDLKIAPSFEPNTEAFFNVLLINNGVKEWPQNVKLILTGNDTQSQTNISSLRSRESKQVKITFLTPKQPNNYTYQWRLCYDEAGSQTFFGPRFTTDFIVVFSGDKKKKFVNIIKNIWKMADYDQIEKFVEKQLIQFPEITEDGLINNYLDQDRQNI